MPRTVTLSRDRSGNSVSFAAWAVDGTDVLTEGEGAGEGEGDEEEEKADVELAVLANGGNELTA